MQKERMADEGSSVFSKGVEQEEYEPRAQNHPHAIDRLAMLMTQYMEH